MLNQIVKLFYPKDFESSLDEKRVRLIVVFCIGMQSVMVLAGIISAFTNPTFNLYLVLLISAIFFLSPLLVLKYSSSIRKASIFFLLLLFSSNAAFNIFGGGFDFRVVIWVLLYTQLAFFMVGRIGGSIAAVFSVIFTVILFVFHAQGIQLPDFINLPATKAIEDGFLSFILMMGLSFVLSFHFEKSQTSLSKKLKEESDKLSGTLKSIKVGTWDFNVKTNSGDWSDELYEIFDFKKGDQPPIEQGLKMYHPDYHSTVEKAFSGLIDEGREYDISVVAITSGGLEKWVRIIGLGRIESSSGTEKVYGIIQDIDHLKKAEEAIKSNEVAQKSLEFKDEFLAKMSHEIRTPLNGIIGLFDLIQGDNLTKNQKDYLGIMKSSGDDLIQIVNDILDIAKLEAGKLTLRKEPFNLGDLARKSSILMASKAKEKNIELKTIIPKFETQFICDSARITQVVNNLLSNAIKFTSEGVVEFAIYEREEGVLFKVTDSGAGIPAEKMDTLFQKFEQLDSSHVKRKDGTLSGTGLGLPICKELVELMGGVLKVESIPGMGSTFSFEIPLQRGGKIEQIQSKPSIKESLTYDLEVLLVDDKLVNLTVGKLLLEKIGCKVDLAKNGLEAVDMVLKNSYDLVLMDIQMPEMDGVEATNKIKRELEQPPLIVGLSANNMDGDKEKYIQKGLDNYLAKPIKLEKLELIFDQYFKGRGKS